MQNISGFGLSANVVASKSFPNGFQVTAFSDDTDPLESPDMELAETAYGLNGHMVVWTRPQGIEIALAVIPGSDDDVNFSALVEANRVGFKKKSAQDIVNITMNYPNGDLATLSSGVIVSGPVIPKRPASSGRFKSNLYKFKFETISRTNTPNVA